MEELMVTRRHILIGGAAVMATASAPFAAYSVLKRRPASGEVIAWIKANALPLASANPGSGFKDLEGLNDILGKARVLGIGEATHGTHEFVTLRHRVIEYGVRNPVFFSSASRRISSFTCFCASASRPTIGSSMIRRRRY